MRNKLSRLGLLAAVCAPLLLLGGCFPKVNCPILTMSGNSRVGRLSPAIANVQTAHCSTGWHTIKQQGRTLDVAWKLEREGSISISWHLYRCTRPGKGHAPTCQKTRFTDVKQ